MPAPKSCEQPQTLLGILDYSQYIPNLLAINQPLRSLLKDKVFAWNPVHNQVLNQLRNQFTTQFNSLTSAAVISNCKQMPQNYV